MGILRATKYKTLLKLSAAVFVLSAVLIANLYPLSANAASLSFSWKDSQTVAVSGTVTGNLVSIGSGSAQFEGTVTGSNLCDSLNITVDTTNTTATLESKPTGPVLSSTGSTPGVPPCYAETFGITSPQPISGARPTAAANETTAQQAVQVRLQSNLNKDASPPSVKFTVKNSSGKVVYSPTVSKTVSATSGLGSANTSFLVDYRYTFTLSPGTYNICFSTLDTCHNFTKIKYQNLTEVYGTLGAYNFINVTISSDAAQSAASTWTVSAQNVLLKQNGKTIQTVVAPQYTHNAVINDQSGGGTSTVTVTQQAQFKNVSPGTYTVCLESGNSCVDVVKVADQPTSPNPIVISIAASIVPDSVGDASNIKCQKSFTNPLTWLVCPMIAAANDAVKGFDDQITCLMQVDLTDVFGYGTNANNPYGNSAACGTGTNEIKTSGKTSSDAYYAAWNTFRSFALALMVIAGLVMVISQAAGFELLDAYTVRKVLPRLLIAGIGITLSWQIMQFLIEITNAVGYGIRDIIYFPFKAFGAPTINGVATSFLGSAAILGGMATYGMAGLAMLALTALLGVMVAFVTLVLRKLIIIFLLMLAPLAIAAYILPNTQKFWKMWWDTLSKALLVFPIIAAMIAVGHVFAATTIANGTGVLNQIIAFIAYFLPYFMIPTAVKMSGGAVGAIAGMVNNRAQGGFGMLRKQRAGIVERRRHNAIERAKTGDIVKGRLGGTRAGEFLNKRVEGLTTGSKGHFGIGQHGQGAIDLQRRVLAGEATKNPKIRELGFDDNAIAVMALSGGTLQGAERAADALKLTGAAKAAALGTAKSVGINAVNASAALGVMAQNKSRALNVNNGLGGLAGMALVRKSASELSFGNKQLEDNLMGNFAYNSRAVGRFDLGGEGADSVYQGWKRATVGQHAGSNSESLIEYSKRFTTEFNNTGSDAASVASRRRATIALMEMQNMLPGASAENQEIINNTMRGVGIDYSSNVSVEQQLASRANVPAVTTLVNGQQQTIPALDARTIRGEARVYDSANQQEGQEWQASRQQLTGRPQPTADTTASQPAEPEVIQPNDDDYNI